MMRRRTLLSLMGAAAVAVSGLSIPPAALAAPPSLTVAMTGDFPSLDPSKDSSPLGTSYRINVFDTLTELARDGKVQPRLADSWSFSPDLLEWTFKLHPGVKFHDGSDFSADDVIFTYQRILDDNTTPVRQFVKLVKSMQKIDDLTVKFTLVQPYAIFNRQVVSIYIMSKKYFEKAGNDGYAKAPVGTGPYKMVSWVKDDRMVLEANDSYFRGAPALKKATYRPIPSEPSRANALASGEVDIVTELPPSVIDQFKNSKDLTVTSAPGFRVTYLAFDPTKAPVDNPLIREAIDVAIDRQSITDKLLRGVGKPTGMMLPPMHIGYDPSFKPVAYNPARAKELVKQAGYKGDVIQIQYPNNNFPMANEVVQAVAGYMTAAGLKVEIKPLEWTAFFPIWLQSKMTNSYLFAFGASQYHAETILAVMYENGSNAHFKDDNEIDRLIKEQRKEADLGKQQKIFTEIFRRSNENRWHLPLYDQMQIYGAKKSLDFVPYADGVVRLYAIK